ncbi:MAG: hypothetical protein JXX28_08455 [Deltaproteobacteria bacterium]|nr:hypothetical protein [Deltaproteobacteria bacterium]
MRRVTALSLLALAGCWSVKTPTMQRAWDLEQQGRWEEAQSRWEQAMGEQVTLQEWKRSREHRCDLTRARLEPEVRGLSPASLSYPRAAALRDELAFCPEHADLAVEVLALEEARAAQELAPLAQRLADEPSYDALTEAWPVLAHLRREHQGHLGWVVAREAWSDRLRAARDEAAGEPVLQAWLTALERTADPAQPEDPPSLEAAAAPALTLTPALRRVAMDEACAALLGSLLPPEVRQEPVGTPYTVDATLTGCREAAASGVRDVPYAETRYRTEVQTVTRSRTTRTTTITPVTNVSCYHSIAVNDTVCTTVGFYDKVETETDTERWDEEIEVQVPYEVELTRRGLFPSRLITGDITGGVSGSFGERSFSAAFTASLEGRELSPSASAADIAAGTPSLAAVVRAGADEAAATLGGTAARLATALHRAELVRRAADRAHPDQSRELLLTAQAGGYALTDEEAAFVAAAVGVPAALARAPSEALALRSPPALDPALVPATWRLPAGSSTIRDGFPPFVGSLSYAHTGSAELPAHASSTAGGLAYGLSLNRSVGTHGGTRGLALHGSLDGQFYFQKRTSDDYLFPADPYGYPNDEELPTAAGYRGAVSLLGGVRTRPFSLFGGVRPQAAGHRIGFYDTVGKAVSYAVRVELRPVERYPILAEAWGGSLGADSPSAAGCQVFWPLHEAGYLSARWESLALPAQVKGRTSYDTLDAGLVELITWSAGLGFGF